MTVQTALASAAELSNWLDNSIRNLEMPPPYGNREWMAAALFDQVHEHHRGIQTLLRSSLDGSAFSLYRSAFDTYFRGVWLLRCASEEEVKKFTKDKIDKTIGQMIA